MDRTNIFELTDVDTATSISLKDKLAHVYGELHGKYILIREDFGKKSYKVAITFGGNRLFYVYPFTGWDELDNVSYKYLFIRELKKHEYVRVQN